MQKRKLILIGVAVVILFLINIIFIINSIYVPNSYTANLEDKKVEVVDDILDNVDFTDDIKENIIASKLYREFMDLNNHEYKQTIYDFMNKTNKKLEINGSSFMQEYNEGKSFASILTTYGGDDYIKFSEAYIVGDENNKEYSKDNVETTYKELLDKVKTCKYNEALNNMDTMLNDYKFTKSYNYKLANVYHDLNLLSVDSNLNSTEILNELYDPSIYLIETMRLYINDRYDIIEDKNSPALNDSNVIDVENVKAIQMNTKSKYYKNIYKEIYNFYQTDTTTDLTIYKITFNIYDGDEFTAYLAVTNDKICHCYKIVANDTKKTYTSMFDKKIEIDTYDTRNDISNDENSNARISNTMLESGKE